MTQYQNNFINEYKIQIDEESANAELIRIFKENQKELMDFFNIKKNFLELKEFSVREQRIAEREMECMAHPWISEYDTSYLDTFAEKREYLTKLKQGAKIKKGEKYLYYFGQQSCGVFGEYTAKIEANEYAKSKNMFDYC